MDETARILRPWVTFAGCVLVARRGVEAVLSTPDASASARRIRHWPMRRSTARRSRSTRALRSRKTWVIGTLPGGSDHGPRDARHQVRTEHRDHRGIISSVTGASGDHPPPRLSRCLRSVVSATQAPCGWTDRRWRTGMFPLWMTWNQSCSPALERSKNRKVSEG